MKRYVPVALVVVFFSVVAAAHQTKSEPATAKSAAQQQFEFLKQLVGEWTGSAQHGSEPPSKEARVTYRLTSGGSVLMETIMPGTPHEMVTMYYVDGNDVVLTHYCALGNQPRMRLQPMNDRTVLKFAFAGGSNIKEQADTYMHNMTLTFVDANHIRPVWSLYRNGKPDVDAKFDLTRDAD